MRKRVAVSLFAVLFFCTAAFAADEFKIDPVHSSAAFTVRHMLVSNVSGRFRDLSGTIVYDDKDPSKSSVNVVIKTTSITTDNDRRDADLRSERFFEVEKYPEIRFQSTKIEKQGDQLVAIGNLTIKDVTRQITLPFTVAKADVKGRTKLGVESSTKLNRYEYNVKYDPTGTTVGGDVKIELNLETNKVEPATAAVPSSSR